MRLGHHAPVQGFHYIERCANDTDIFTQTVCFWYRYVCLTQCADNAVLSIDSVSSFTEEPARRSLANNILCACGVRDLVGRVRLTEAELCE